MKLHERLLKAREQLGLTLKQVEEKTGIGYTSLSDFERGQRDPSFAHLGKLAKLYHRPVSFFLEEGEVEEQGVLWRHQPPSPAKEEIEAQFLELCRQYRNLEIWGHDDKFNELPQFAAIADEAAFAKQMRAMFGLGRRPAFSLMMILEDVFGVKVFHLPLPDGRNAISAVSPEFGYAVLLNISDSLRERVFSLAHELYHLLTWTTATPSEEEERKADRFAIHLLLPPEALRAASASLIKENQIRLPDLAILARQFGVPLGVVLRGLAYQHGHEIGDCDVCLNEQEPASSSPPSRPNRYCDLARKVYRQGDISLGKLAEYLGISRSEAKSKYFDEEDNVVAV